MVINRGIFYKMQQVVPDKGLLGAPTAGGGATYRSCVHCPWVATDGLKATAEGLEQNGTAYEIYTDAALREGALLPSDRMLEFTATLRT